MWVNNEVGPRVGAKKSLRFANDELVAAAARATVHTANVFLWPVTSINDVGRRGGRGVSQMPLLLHKM